jgi:hypothetical protein
MLDKAAGEPTCIALVSNESPPLKVTHAETLHIVFLISAPWFFVLLLPRFRQRLLKTLLKSSKSVCKQELIYAHVAGQEAMVDFAGEWRSEMFASSFRARAPLHSTRQIMAHFQRIRWSARLSRAMI